MSRPIKQRFVASPPRTLLFKPQARPLATLEQVVLTEDGLEALRLADLQGDSHEQGAAKMNISRPTFGRILERARRAVADALVNGKALQIVGGEVVRTRHAHVHCKKCRRPWDVPSPVAGSFRCPHCRA